MKSIVILWVAVGVAVADVSELANGYLPPPLFQNGILGNFAETEAPAAAVRVELDATTTVGSTTVVEIEQVPLKEMHYDEQQRETIQTTEKPAKPLIYDQPSGFIYETPILEARTEVPVEEVPVSVAVPVSEAALFAEGSPLTEEAPTDLEAPVIADLPNIRELPIVGEVSVVEETSVSEEAPAAKEVPISVEAPVSEEIPFVKEIKEVPSAEKATISEEIPAVSELDAEQAPNKAQVINEVSVSEVSPNAESDTPNNSIPVSMVEELPAPKQILEAPVFETEPKPAHELGVDGYHYRTANHFRFRK